MGRLKRQKNHRKHLEFYRMQFQFKRPYKILLDGNFIHHCVKNNINVRDRLETAFSDKSIQPYVPDEVIEELTEIGAPCAEALAIASTFKRAASHGDKKKPRPSPQPTKNIDETQLNPPTNDEDAAAEDTTPTPTAADGILRLLGHHNRHHYIVATQDVGLRKATYKIPGVPVLYLNIGVSVIEAPSKASKGYQAMAEQKKLAPRKDERRRLQQKQQDDLRRQHDQERVPTGRDAELRLPKRSDVTSNPTKLKKRKGPRGPKQPNPLSMRKKKRAAPSTTNVKSTSTKSKRRRKNQQEKKRQGKAATASKDA